MLKLVQGPGCLTWLSICVSMKATVELFLLSDAMTADYNKESAQLQNDAT